MKLTRESLLKAVELRTEEVEINGGTVTAKELCAAEYLDTLEHPFSKKENGDYDGTAFNALLVARCIVNEDGSRMFADEDADLLRNGSFSVYRKLIESVNRVNGLAGEQAKN